MFRHWFKKSETKKSAPVAGTAMALLTAIACFTILRDQGGDGHMNPIVKMNGDRSDAEETFGIPSFSLDQDSKVRTTKCARNLNYFKSWISCFLDSQKYNSWYSISILLLLQQAQMKALNLKTSLQSEDPAKSSGTSQRRNSYRRELGTSILFPHRNFVSTSSKIYNDEPWFDDQRQEIKANRCGSISHEKINGYWYMVGSDSGGTWVSRTVLYFQQQQAFEYLLLFHKSIVGLRRRRLAI